jgi:hypothetical protein
MSRTRFVVMAVVLAAALGHPVGAAPTPTWNELELNDSEQPGSVLVFHLFKRGEETIVFDTTDLVVPRTELEISVVCPKGETCVTEGEFEDRPKVFLRAHWVCPGEFENGELEQPTCVETNFPLSTTVNGTIYFHPQGRDPNVTDIILDPENDFFVDYEDVPRAPCDEGFLIVWVVNEYGQAIKFDGLIGDAIVRHDEDTASGYNALPIQASSALRTFDVTDLDAPAGDLDFDGSEYKAITGKIFGTVRYESPFDTFVEIAPKTKLTLLTLDVKSNKPNNPTFVDLNFYNEFEKIESTYTKFVCWTSVRLRDIDPELNTFFGRKGVVESAAAVKEPFLGIDDRSGPVTLIGIVTTIEMDPPSGDDHEYSYSLFHDGKPVATAFEPKATTNNNTNNNGSPPPSNASTITFDSYAGGQALDGEYPAGVADWGSGYWYLSGPWGQFTTNSISFSGEGATSASFTFVSPKRLVSLNAYNGGDGPSTVTISCGGNPTKSVAVGANQVVTISTGWTNACSAVTIGSSNGWNTNFDNLTYQ